MGRNPRRIDLERHHSSTYTVFMKNITLSVDDEILQRVRRYAVEHGSTVNALVRDFLTEIAQREDRARRARERIRKLSRTSAARISPSYSTPREHRSR